MRWAELIAAVVFGALGVRSVAYWLGRPFEGGDRVDHMLFALYVAGRTGMWFAFSGLFFLLGLNDAEGRRLIDEAQDVRWYLLVFVVLGVAQLLGGWFLGHRKSGADR